LLPGRQYTPEQIFRLLWNRKVMILAVVFAVTAAAIGLTLMMPNRYRSETLILVIPQRVPDVYVHSTVTMRIEDRLRSLREEILSRSRLERVIADLDLYAEARQTQPMESIVQQMQGDITVEPIRDDAFKVSFVAPTPRTAMIVTDRLASAFIDENTRDRESLADGTNRFLESQLADARARLVDHEKKLENFRTRYSGQLPSQLDSNLQVIRNTQNQIQALNESIDRDRDRRLVLERTLSDSQTSAVPPGSNAATGSPAPVRVADELARARAELAAMELRLKPANPDIAAKKRQIDDLQRRADSESQTAAHDEAASQSTPDALVRQDRARQTQTEIAGLDQQISQKTAEIERLKKVAIDYQHRVDSVPGHESELTSLMRDYDTLQKIYAGLLAKKEDSRISANLERQQAGEQFRILDPARLPVRPSSPNRTRIALFALAASVMLGIGLVSLFEYRDTSLRTEDEIVRTLVLPVVATIPVLMSLSERRAERRQTVVTVVGAIALVVSGVGLVVWRFHLLRGWQ